ncbi:unnamed protein product [Ectocarpus sp. CCAP 1310/34]|nr:unnamed protein product [Ectocarpus sp. CCAP 1310/34]
MVSYRKVAEIMWTATEIQAQFFCAPFRVHLAQKEYVKPRELQALKDTWGGEQAVLAQLRKLLQVASALTFAVRSPSFDKAERKKLMEHARDTVGVYAELLGRGGVRTTVHSALHYVQAYEDHGELRECHMPDASTGEAAHQRDKKVNHSNSGRNAAAHFARRFNMDLAIDALAEETPRQVTRFDRRLKKYVMETVKAGSGCSAVLRSLGDVLPGGLSSAPTDARAASIPTAAQRAAQFPGASNLDKRAVGRRVA